MKTPNMACKVCGAPIYAQPHQVGRKKYCSYKCHGLSKIDALNSARRPDSVTSEELTYQVAKSMLDYDAETGKFFWKQDRGGTARKGVEAGSKMKTGYIAICIGLKKYLAHRLAYLFVHGAWPTDQVDHINGTRDDNRAANLRASTTQLNQANRKALAKSGVKGVWYDKKRGKWQAKVVVKGKTIHAGRHDTRDEAAAAYMEAARAAFGEHASDGVRRQ